MSIVNYLKRIFIYAITGAKVKHVSASISYLSPNERLKEKKILITGGNRGLGYSMARKFIEEGASVIITGRDEDKLKKVSAELDCLYLKYDVLDVSKCDAIISRAVDKLGGLDCLVNNAGISLHEGNIRNVTPFQFDSQFNTNLRGGYFLSQSFIKYFESEKRDKGNILFVSSERGTYVDDIPYGLTKAAMNSLVQGLSKRVITSNIRVNSVGPGVTASDLTGYNPDGDLYRQQNTRGRVYLPEEIAEIACFLLSDASSCVSGQIIVCDEGKSANSYWK